MPNACGRVRRGAAPRQPRSTAPAVGRVGWLGASRCTRDRPAKRAVLQEYARHRANRRACAPWSPHHPVVDSAGSLKPRTRTSPSASTEIIVYIFGQSRCRCCRAISVKRESPSCRPSSRQYPWSTAGYRPRRRGAQKWPKGMAYFDFLSSRGWLEAAGQTQLAKLSKARSRRIYCLPRARHPSVSGNACARRLLHQAFDWISWPFIFACGRGTSRQAHGALAFSEDLRDQNIPPRQVYPA